MDLAQGHQAVEPSQQRGMPLEAITAPKVREVIGAGRYPTMTASLRPIRGESAGGLDESESRRNARRRGHHPGHDRRCG